MIFEDFFINDTNSIIYCINLGTVVKRIKLYNELIANAI